MKTFIYFAILALILSSTSFVLAKDWKISEDQNELYDIQSVRNTELIPQNFETFEETALPWNYSGIYTQTGSDGCIISGDFHFSVNADSSASGGYRPNADSCRPEWALSEIVTVGALVHQIGPPDTIKTGDSTVILEGYPVARLNDNTDHGGVIVEGSDRIFVNGVPAAFLGGFASCPVTTTLFSVIPHVGGPIVNYGWSNDPLDTLAERMEQAKRDSEFCTQLELIEPGLAYENGGALADWCVQNIIYLNTAASRGDIVLDVDGTGIEIGDTVVIGNDPGLLEMAKVIGKGSLILDQPLENSYPEGTLIKRVPDEYANVTEADDEGGSGGGGGGCFIGTLRY